MSESVQFRGKDQLLNAFDARGVETWGIFQKKNLITKGSGHDELDAFLVMLAEGESKAVYTLKIFEDIDDVKNLKENSAADGSINFMLYEYDADGGGGEYLTPYSRTNRKNKLFQRLEAIENKINGIVEESEETEDFNKVVRREVIGIIEDPNKLLQWIDIFQVLKGQKKNNTATLQPAIAAIGNAAVKTNTAITDDEKFNRLTAAIETLSNNDANLIEHLEKLAKLSATDPNKFNGLLKMLELF